MRSLFGLQRGQTKLEQRQKETNSGWRIRSSLCRPSLRCVSFRGQDYPSPLRSILLSSAMFSVLEWPEICTNVLCSRSIHCESHLTFWLWAGASDKGSVFICTQLGTRDTYDCGQAKQTRRAIRKRSDICHPPYRLSEVWITKIGHFVYTGIKSCCSYWWFVIQWLWYLVLERLFFSILDLIFGVKCTLLLLLFFFFSHNNTT